MSDRQPDRRVHRGDEQLVTALAATAGIAIANARLHADSEQQRHWLTASTGLTQELLGGSPRPPMKLVAQYAQQGASADLATVATIADDDHAQVRVATGVMAPVQGRVVPLGSSLVGRVIRTGKPVLVNDYEREFDPELDFPLPNTVGSAIGVPLQSTSGVVFGALTVGRIPGRAPFTENDRDQLSGFGANAGLALKLGEARNRTGTNPQSLGRIGVGSVLSATLLWPGADYRVASALI